MLTLLVSSRVGPSLWRLVGQQMASLLLLRRPPRRAGRLHRHGQPRMVILQPGILKGVLRREGVTRPATEGVTEGTQGLGTGRVALRRRRPTVVMKWGSLSEKKRWWQVWGTDMDSGTHSAA